MANILIVEDEKNMQDIIVEYMKLDAAPSTDTNSVGIDASFGQIIPDFAV